jgi:hypothetical protein
MLLEYLIFFQINTKGGRLFAKLARLQVQCHPILSVLRGRYLHTNIQRFLKLFWIFRNGLLFFKNLFYFFIYIELYYVCMCVCFVCDRVFQLVIFALFCSSYINCNILLYFVSTSLWMTPTTCVVTLPFDLKISFKEEDLLRLYISVCVCFIIHACVCVGLRVLSLTCGVSHRSLNPSNVLTWHIPPPPSLFIGGSSTVLQL